MHEKSTGIGIANYRWPYNLQTGYPSVQHILRENMLLTCDYDQGRALESPSYDRDGHVKEADVRAEEEPVLELIQELGAIIGIASQCVPRVRVG